MIRRHYFLLLLWLLAATATGCTRRAYTPDERPNAGIVPPVQLNTQLSDNQLSGTGFIDNQHVTQSIDLKASAFNRATDALGLSTPAGRAARQQRKLIAAGVPRTVKVKDGALAWGTYAKATSAGKKATLATDSATLQMATNAVAGRGNTARQTAATQQAKDWRAVLAGPVGSVLALALAAGIVLFLLRRKAAKSLL